MSVDNTLYENEILISDLAKGTYIAKFTSLTDNSVTTTKKIILK